ncbi:MAG: ISNCY family transposase [Terriglobia bacterium]
MALSKRERDRLVVLRQLKQGKLTQRAAAEQLGLSPRWVRKLARRLRQQGDRGLAHRLRGRVSNRAHDAPTRRRALELVREHYPDYGPTLASEMLASDHDLAVNRETLRQWMSREGLWKPRRARLKRAHVWRARRRRRGELVQWDTSEHDWLEGRGPKLYLTAMIDDATSELVARFASSDSTAENLRLLGRYLEQRGRPVAVYTDKASLFQVNRPLHHNKHLDGKPQPTQIGRALEELDIRRVTAHSPQAKGRVERCFGTLQDRLVKALRRVGADDVEQANRYLEEKFLAEWNERFTREPAEAVDAHRRLRKDQRAASILSHVESRVIGNDYTVSWQGRRYQIAAGEAKPRMRKASVRVEQRLDGELWLRWGAEQMRLRECPEPEVGAQRGAPAAQDQPAATARAPKAPAKRERKRKSRWMEGFSLGGGAGRGSRSPATPVALRAPSVAGDTS